MISRMNRILQNPAFRRHIEKNDKAELNRVFCKHGLQHALEVARILYILNLEDGADFEKDIIYAAALLHDIGKWEQYKKGVPHNASSAKYAAPILSECGYDEEEIEIITTAIMNHREMISADGSLSFLLFTADKMSRACYVCAASEDCNWSKKNDELTY